jgi:hypothetical protein
MALVFLCQVAQLKAAGAIVLAKTNMAEWAYTNAVSIGSAFGIVRNPYDLDRVTAGRLFLRIVCFEHQGKLCSESLKAESCGQ